MIPTEIGNKERVGLLKRTFATVPLCDAIFRTLPEVAAISYDQETERISLSCAEASVSFEEHVTNNLDV